MTLDALYVGELQDSPQQTMLHQLHLTSLSPLGGGGPATVHSSAQQHQIQLKAPVLPA